MAYPTYLVHFNPNHDPKNGRFTYRPGSTILPKGTKVNSVSSKYINSESYKNSGNWIYTYRKDETWDNKVYKGPFSVYLISYRGAQFIKEHEFETVADLKMPTRQEREQEFKDMLNDPKWKKTMVKELDNIRKACISMQIDGKEGVARFKAFNPGRIVTEKDYEVAYELFGHAMEDIRQYKMTIEYARRISSKWDAMVDDNNYKTYNNAIDPLIIFKAEKFLKDVSDPNNPKYLSLAEIKKNYYEVKEVMEKEGKSVLL